MIKSERVVTLLMKVPLVFKHRDCPGRNTRLDLKVYKFKKDKKYSNAGSKSQRRIIYVQHLNATKYSYIKVNLHNTYIRIN